MKTIILGASGQIGGFLLKGLSKNQLLEVNGTSRYCKDSLIKFDPFKDDWKKLGKVDILINCVGQIEVSKEFDYSRIHKTLTQLIIRNRMLMGNPTIIQMSALGASVNHFSDFLRTKGEADEVLLTENNTYVIRPSIVCTPGTMLARKMSILGRLGRLLSNRLIIPKGFLGNKIQPILIEDLTDLIENICIHGAEEKIIDAVGPEQWSFNELIKILESNLNVHFKINEVSEKLVRAIVKLLIDPFFSHIIDYDQYKLLFEDNISVFSSSEKILGRKLSSTRSFWEDELMKGRVEKRVKTKE